MTENKVFRQCILLTEKQRKSLSVYASVHYEGNISLLVRKIIDDWEAALPRVKIKKGA